MNNNEMKNIFGKNEFSKSFVETLKRAQLDNTIFFLESYDSLKYFCLTFVYCHDRRKIVCTLNHYNFVRRESYNNLPGFISKRKASILITPSLFVSKIQTNVLAFRKFCKFGT